MSASHFQNSRIRNNSCLETLKPGVNVQLQFSFPTAKRVSATLIGYEAGDFLLVRLADNGNWHQFDRHFYQDNSVVARLLDESDQGQCLAFRSKIEWASTKPYNLLYLSYPDVVEQYHLRAFKRLTTCISAQISGEQDTPVEGVLSDVSLGGCCFTFDLPDGKYAVSEKTVTLAAGESLFVLSDIRNQRALRGNQLAVGMQFRNGPAEIQQALKKLHVPPSALVG